MRVSVVVKEKRGESHAAGAHFLLYRSASVREPSASAGARVHKSSRNCSADIVCVAAGGVRCSRVGMVENKNKNCKEKKLAFAAALYLSSFAFLPASSPAPPSPGRLPPSPSGRMYLSTASA